MVVHTKKFIWQLSNTEKQSESQAVAGKEHLESIINSLSLDENLKILDENKRKKTMNYKIMVDEFKISKI